ncbi:MAG: phytoene desaturase family protein [Sphingomonadaceae bacterium]
MDPPDKTQHRDPGLTSACVIGAGLGGLAAAIRLQASGVKVTLIEARREPGGCLRRWRKDGFTFEEGPSLVADPAPLRELWSLTGEDMGNAVEMVEVTPACRFAWSDGAQFDAGSGEAELARQLARLAPADIAGFEEFRRWCAAARIDGWQRLAEGRLDSPAAAARALPALVRTQGWRSAWSLVSSFVKDRHLREALAYPVLQAGANPLNASALHLLGQVLPGGTGGWWPVGGMAGLAEALAARFEQLGGTLRLHDPVVRLHAVGNRIGEVECQSGWRGHFTAAVSNADAFHTYRDLLKDLPRGPQMAGKLARRRYSPSAFSVHFALEGSWPGIPHQSVLLGPRFGELLADLFEHGVLPQDFMLGLHHPSLTDPVMAPPGKSVFRATIPAAHMGKLPIDWEAVAPLVSRRILDEIGRRLIPDIHDRVITGFTTSPRDLALELGYHLGSAWSLEASPLQSGPLRLAHKDPRLANVYLVGSASHPGAGVAGVLAGAKAAAQQILGELT